MLCTSQISNVCVIQARGLNKEKGLLKELLCQVMHSLLSGVLLNVADFSLFTVYLCLVAISCLLAQRVSPSTGLSSIQAIIYKL